MTSAHYQTVCVTCRVVTSGAINCGHDLASVGPKWRAPRRTNDRAWKRIERGEWLWDRDAAQRKDRWTRRAWEAYQGIPLHQRWRGRNGQSEEARQKWADFRREEERKRLVEAGVSERKMKKRGF